jgi:outer membrane protein assembly factor BamB
MVVVAIDGEPGGIAAFDATSGERIWHSDVRAESELVVGGPAVVVKSGRSVFGLSARDGSELWQRRAELMDYMGAAIDGDLAVLSFSTAGQRSSSYREGRAIAVDARSGRVRWTLGPVQSQVGAPAATGGVVFVPWDRHSLSALDGATGRELARLLSRDDVYSFVTAGPEGVFFGSNAAYRFDERAASGLRDEASVYEPLVANTPSTSGFAADGFLGSTGGRNARNKIRFLWRGGPETGDEVRLVDDKLYFLYFRIVIAFDSRTGEVLWARSLPRDVEAATAVPGGVLALDAGGDLLALEASTGRITHRASLGVTVANAAFDVASLPRGEGEAVETPRTDSVRDQLVEIVFDPDARLTPARRFALSVLASIPDAEVTQSLIEICRQRRVPVQIRNDAAIVLRTRQAGAEYLNEALDEHYDFLESREAPPVGVIAGAALYMRNEAAVPRLLDHLEDPETPFDDLAPIAAALTELGNPGMVPRLKGFVVRYRADREFRGREEPLLEFVRAIGRHGADADRQAIAALAQQPRTLPALVDGIEAALAPPPAPEAAGGEAADATTVSAEQIAEVMQDARDRIRPCIQSALRREGDLREVRITLVIASDGDLVGLNVNPPDDILGSCLTLSLAQSSFPRGDEDRRQVDYTIQIQQAPPEPQE